jgi:(p)ppGpp synthase/HD superfamily hydrolase
MSSKIQWCIDQHNKTNHMYDTYLPYEFHLRMVAQAAKQFIHLIPDSNDGEETLRNYIILAAWGHDLIEDTRVSYNDVKDQLGLTAADIIYACTNEKGKNRKERANDKYYEGIRNTPGAVFVKLCDRIANVQYSKMTQSRMFEMYKKENKHFTESLGLRGDIIEYPGHEYYEMYKYLNTIFHNK